MGDRDDKLGIEDTSGLTDADWAEINKLANAYETGGDEELVRAFKRLKEDPVRLIRVWGAFFPHKVREMLKDKMADMGITIEDLREMMTKIKPPPMKQ